MTAKVTFTDGREKIFVIDVRVNFDDFVLYMMRNYNVENITLLK